MKNYKKDFPLLCNSDIVYLDSGATSQKPSAVLSAFQNYYQNDNANAYRGVYKLSQIATQKYSEARKVIADFVGAKEEEIVFTKNSTESLNLLAYSYGLSSLKKGDEIVLSIMEHHSNLVPWQIIAKKTGAKLKYLYLDKNLQIPSSELEKITSKTKIVAITAMSNVLGSIVNVKKIATIAHKVGAVVVCDATQIVAHKRIDVKKLDVDFACFSAHKMYGPLGLGVLYGKKALLDKMPPFLYGGDMIEYVSEQDTTFAPLPNKFEAGTQDIASAVGLASAIEYMSAIGFENIQAQEKELYDYALSKLKELSFVELYIPKGECLGVISFNIKGIHAHDVSSILDSQNICIRSGNHCAQPLLKSLGLDSTCRISFGIYNTKSDVDKLVKALKQTYKMFAKYLERGNGNGLK